MKLSKTDKVRRCWALLVLMCREAVPTPWLLWIPGIIGVVLGSFILTVRPGFLGAPSPDDGRTPFYYMLSTQAQVLATILALVLTLSLVAGQLASRYSHRAFNQVFGWWWGPYFLLYILGTALPLSLLLRNFSLTEVRLSLWVAIICLTSLLPYFVVLKRRLSMNSIICRLKETAITGYGAKIRWATRCSANAAVRILDDIAVGAFKAHDLDSFDSAIRAMSFIAVNLIRVNQNSEPVRRILDQLKNIGSRVFHDSSARGIFQNSATKSGLVVVRDHVKREYLIECRITTTPK